MKEEESERCTKTTLPSLRRVVLLYCKGKHPIIIFLHDVFGSTLLPPPPLSEENGGLAFLIDSTFVKFYGRECVCLPS